MAGDDATRILHARAALQMAFIQVARLRQDMLEVLALPDVKQRLAANNTVLETSTPEEFHKLIVADIERWGRVVREAKISVK